MGRRVVIEMGTGMLAVAALAYFYPAPLAAVLLGLAGMFVLFYGLMPRGDDE